MIDPNHRIHFILQEYSITGPNMDQIKTKVVSGSITIKQMREIEQLLIRPGQLSNAKGRFSDYTIQDPFRIIGTIDSLVFYIRKTNSENSSKSFFNELLMEEKIVHMPEIEFTKDDGRVFIVDAEGGFGMSLNEEDMPEMERNFFKWSKEVEIELKMYLEEAK